MTNSFRKTKFRKTILSCAITAALTPVLTSSALAQTSILEEIIVTATKRAANVQDLPISVTAIDGAVLSDLGIYQSFDLVKVAPGLKMEWTGSGGSAGLEFKMRGGGVAGLNGPAVPLYTNGLEGGTNFAGWVDLERIEVMKGPQGTLYGANTLGGLVNIIAKKPNTEAFDYGVALTGGDYSFSKLEGFVNVPLGDTFAVRLSGTKTDQDPLIENADNPAGGLRDEDNYYVRAQAFWAPTDTFDVNVEYTKWETDSMGNASFGSHIIGLVINSETGRSSGFGDHIEARMAPINGDVQTGGRTYHNADPETNPTGYYEIAGNFANFWEASFETLGVEVNWDIGFADLNVRARHDEREHLTLWDVDNGSNNLGEGWLQNEQTDQIDVVLGSKSDEALRWTLGYYWSDAWDEDDNYSSYLWSYNDSNEIGSDTRYPAWTYWDKFGEKSQAVYASAEYDISDAVTISAGVRYQEDSTKATRYLSNYYGDKSVWGSGYSTTSRLLDASYYDQAGATDEVIDADHTDYRVAVSWAVNDDVMFYGSVSTGYIPRIVDSGEVLLANELDTYELGIKSSWADNTVRFNAAYYYSDYTNLSFLVYEAVGASIASRNVTGGDLNSQGVEFEFLWQPVDALTLVAGLIFDDTEFGNFHVFESVFTEGRFVEIAGHPDGGYYPYRPGGHSGDWLRSDTDEVILPPEYDLSGTRAALSPEYIFNLDVSYRVEIGGGGAIIPGLTMYSQDDYRTMNNPYTFANQPSYTTMDLRVTWETPVENLVVKAFLTNATGELYKVSQEHYSGGRVIAEYGKQRLWGVRFGYNF